MNNRERFKATMHFEPVDRPSHMEHGFWKETVQRWHTEGLPQDTHYLSHSEFYTTAYDIFSVTGVMKPAYLLADQYFSPEFEYAVLEEDDFFRIERNAKGVLQKVSKTVDTIPMYLEYPVKSPKDYYDIRDRLLARNLDKRYPKDWDEHVKRLKEQTDFPVCTHMDGFFAAPRELMGVDALLYNFYDEPELVRDIINDRADFYLDVYERAFRDAKPDFAFIWEDMSFCGGSFISGAMVEEFLMPAYKKVCNFIRDMGVDIIVTDSDGDVTGLIPYWMRAGINCVLPFEVKAGSDIVKIGEQFPDLRMVGGIDKHKIAKGKDAIDDELERVLPAMMKRGGYCISLDHWVPPEISYEDFQYYVKKVSEFKL